MSEELKHTKCFASQLHAKYDQLCKEAVPFDGAALLTHNQEIYFKRLLKSARIQVAVLGYLTKGTKHALKGFMVRCGYWDPEQCKTLKISFNDLVRLNTELIRAKEFFEQLDYFKDWEFHIQRRAEEIHFKELLIEEEYWSIRIFTDENKVPADELPYLTRMRLKVEASNHLSLDNLDRYNELNTVKVDPEYKLIHQMFFDYEVEKKTVRMFKSKTQVKNLIGSYCKYYNERFAMQIFTEQRLRKNANESVKYNDRKSNLLVPAADKELIYQKLIQLRKEGVSSRKAEQYVPYKKTKIAQIYKEIDELTVREILPKVKLYNI